MRPQSLCGILRHTNDNLVEAKRFEKVVDFLHIMVQKKPEATCVLYIAIERSGESFVAVN